MYGEFIGSGGVRQAHLPSLIVREFGVSYSEARRLVADGEVELDGETCERIDVPVDDLVGKELRIGRETIEVEG